MPLEPPPYAMAYQVERAVPGIYRAFLSRVIDGADADAFVTSWYRTQADNATVGGHPASQHLIGLAVDVSGRDLEGMASRWEGLGLRVVPYRSHVHLQAWPAGTAARTGLLRALGL